ncbi:MAG TPA: AAA family ATPase [Candidatus Nanoarchaeia archaeon]|nr:AAA family ATPase [Candidatus Nanoarchaeia archaeon]
MRLKKITLNNIRSYESQEINFPEGSTLLSGDIGSGKTSILLGIEFALFGLQPGQRGGSLLRNGTSEGGVVLYLDIDGREVIIERKMKKGKTISQDYCSITIAGEKKEMSVTELKDRVLEILSYPKEFSKKQNILYKFTVYTPQEEMKQIILEDPETRINALRHVFGIDRYKTVIENAEIIASRMREEKRLKEGQIENLEEDRAILISREEELEAKHHNLVSVEKELFLRAEEMKRRQEERAAVFLKIEEKNKLQQEIEKTKIIVSNKKETLFGNEKNSGQLQAQIKELESLEFDETKIKEMEQQIKFRKKEKAEIDEENLKVSSQINSMNLKNQDNKSLKEKLRHIEICPTCLQNVGPVYKSNVINKLDSETSENLKKIEALTLEKRKVLENILEIENWLSAKEKELSDLRLQKMKSQEIDAKRVRLRETEKSSELLKKDITLLSQHIEALTKSIFELKKFESVLEMKEKDLKEALKQERMAEIKVAELKKEIEVFSRHIEELRIRIKKTEEIREKLENITKLEEWISGNFISMISFTEKNVMVRLKSQFSSLFAEWFSMLVSDVFDVALDEEFTPIIHHQDYEIDYAYLSGGERTAIALAYRLSLNQVVNSLLSRIKTRDIVILDEPTDGFSEQQLDKMRDVLRQLEVKQLIIVSHEPKIENFVENVIRFRKEHGVSKMIEEKLI